VTGTDALHPRHGIPSGPALPLRTRPRVTCCVRRSLASLRPSFLRAICARSSFAVGILLALFGLTLLSAPLLGADVDFPTVSPYHTIHVTAETVARQVRGSYDVLAFRGQCTLRQGELQAACQDLILWVDRTAPDDPQQPRKVICTMEGQVQLQWDSRPLLQDSRWMGHLFSYQEVNASVRSEIARNDIPSMDWARDPGSGVAPAQFTSMPPATTAAPPLLQQNTLPSPQPRAPNGLDAAAAPNNSTSALQLTAPRAVEPLPGAVQWLAENRSFTAAKRRFGHTQ
jgi:hypothetical protein